MKLTRQSIDLRGPVLVNRIMVPLGISLVVVLGVIGASGCATAIRKTGEVVRASQATPVPRGLSGPEREAAKVELQGQVVELTRLAATTPDDRWLQVSDDYIRDSKNPILAAYVEWCATHAKEGDPITSRAFIDAFFTDMVPQ